MDLDDDFLCVCASGFTGPECLEQQDPCDDNICVNGASCSS